jgi:hypothetical protein
VGRLRRQDWVVYVKPAFGGTLQVLRYLGRYTHRIAISNHRLVAFNGERVTFRWSEHAHGNKSRVMTLDAVEFLRRFFLHVLPKGFVRIRHFGFLANRHRTKRLDLCRQLLRCVVSEAILASPTGASIARCPRCGAPTIILVRLTSDVCSHALQEPFYALFGYRFHLCLTLTASFFQLAGGTSAPYSEAHPHQSGIQSP